MTGIARLRLINPFSRVLLIILAVLACHRPAAAALTLAPTQQMYSLYGHLNFPSELYRIDLVTLTAERIGSTGLRFLESFAASPDGTLYSWHGTQGLVTINRTTGVASDVNPAVPSTIPGHFSSIDVAPNGNIVGTLQRGSGNEVYEIDRTTGTVIAMREHPLPPGHPAVHAIAFVGNRLFAVNGYPSSSTFFEIDFNSAAFTTVGSTGEPSLLSLAADLHGNLFSMVAYRQTAELNFEVVRIDPASGISVESAMIYQPVVRTNFTHQGLAIVTVPEPVTSYWALWGGCAVLWTLGRRGRELRR
jgi:DNA-binding beta-propeller fold protein YncE